MNEVLRLRNFIVDVVEWPMTLLLSGLGEQACYLPVLWSFDLTCPDSVEAGE